MAKWIISHFPKHRHYVEPFGGGANVLLIKEPSPLETYNDLDGDIVTFFKILRERPAELVRSIRMTPWSRREFETYCREINNESPVERSRRLFYRYGTTRLAWDKSITWEFFFGASELLCKPESPQVLFACGKFVN